MGVGTSAIVGLGEFVGKEWGGSIGDLSPLGPQAHVTVLKSPTQEDT